VNDRTRTRTAGGGTAVGSEDQIDGVVLERQPNRGKNVSDRIGSAFAGRDLSGVDYVYLWVDGIVRHEALHDRVGVGDLHRRAVVAAG
jgi:hypothetical protein